MPRKQYHILNFFLNRDHTIFYLNLMKNEKREMKLYSIAKTSKISRQNAVLMLFHFKKNNLIDYEYDSSYFSHVVKFTKEGRELHIALINIARILVKNGIWGNNNVFS